MKEEHRPHTSYQSQSKNKKDISPPVSISKYILREMFMGFFCFVLTFHFRVLIRMP